MQTLYLDLSILDIYACILTNENCTQIDVKGLMLILDIRGWIYLLTIKENTNWICRSLWCWECLVLKRLMSILDIQRWICLLTIKENAIWICHCLWCWECLMLLNLSTTMCDLIYTQFVHFSVICPHMEHSSVTERLMKMHWSKPLLLQ